LLHVVGYLHRCTKMMHGHTNIMFTVHTVYVVQEINPCLCCHTKHINTLGEKTVEFPVVTAGGTYCYRLTIYV